MTPTTMWPGNVKKTALAICAWVTSMKTKKPDWNQHEHPCAHAPFCGERGDFTSDMAAIFDRFSQLIENLRQIAAGLGLHAENARDHERLVARHALSHLVHGVEHAHAKVGLTCLRGETRAAQGPATRQSRSLWIGAAPKPTRRPPAMRCMAASSCEMKASPAMLDLEVHEQLKTAGAHCGDDRQQHDETAKNPVCMVSTIDIHTIAHRAGHRQARFPAVSSKMPARSKRSLRLVTRAVARLLSELQTA